MTPAGCLVIVQGFLPPASTYWSATGNSGRSKRDPSLNPREAKPVDQFQILQRSNSYLGSWMRSALFSRRIQGGRSRERTGCGHLIAWRVYARRASRIDLVHTVSQCGASTIWQRA
jgi:hypothetical protein